MFPTLGQRIWPILKLPEFNEVILYTGDAMMEPGELFLVEGFSDKYKPIVSEKEQEVMKRDAIKFFKTQILQNLYKSNHLNLQ